MATVQMIQPYQTFKLKNDLNPVITKGMICVILVVLSDDTFEAEFVKEDGTNYEYGGNYTFTIKSEQIDALN